MNVLCALHGTVPPAALRGDGSAKPRHALVCCGELSCTEEPLGSLSGGFACLTEVATGQVRFFSCSISAGSEEGRWGL